jgi:hypothetical protein
MSENLEIIKEIELNSTMSEECKMFVLQSFKKRRPYDIFKYPVDVTRETRDNYAIKLNEKVTFNNLEMNDFLVKSPYDGYDIQVIF